MSAAMGAPSPDGAHGTGSASVAFWPMIPTDAPLSGYDYENVATYYRLLLAQAHGASESDMARDVFLGRKTASCRIAVIAVRAHLYRAHWLIENKFLPLMWLLDD